MSIIICEICGESKPKYVKKQCKRCYDRLWKRKHQNRATPVQRAYNIKNPYKRWCWNTIDQHKRRGYNVKIRYDTLLRKAKRTPNCELCGLKLDYSYGGKKGIVQPNSPHLDRKDNDKKITLKNVQILCRFCSQRKNWLTQDEYEMVLNNRLMIEKI